MSVTFDRDLLDRLLILLGDPDGDLRFLLPFFESTLGAGAVVQDVSSRGFHAVNQVAADNNPVIRGNLFSNRFNGTDEYLEIADNNLLTARSAGVDTAFSVGCAFKMFVATAAVKNLITKWDDQTPNAEWRLSLTALEYPALEVFDNSVANSNMGREDQTAIVEYEWNILVATYGGVGGPAPEADINLYLYNNGTYLGAVDDANIDGGGVYVDMENTVQPIMIGAADTAAGPVAAEWFRGEMMMPFYTMRELSAGTAEKVIMQMVRLMEL